MSDEDRRYLRALNKKRPSMEVFNGMVEILTSAHRRTDQLLNKLKTLILETYKPA